ncbi:hypothetical protein PR048_015881 [Dryococelus australis]|uniref:Uncharacterized protein n=1 Tax=Dryococelus australis TaxID=614101 RepID=A0ABQ9HI59_9NEOP|nr:hypothetical protein PR048_015881 [Dryococelus australis]
MGWSWWTHSVASKVPRLNPIDFFVCEYYKGLVYSPGCHNLEELTRKQQDTDGDLDTSLSTLRPRDHTALRPGKEQDVPARSPPREGARRPSSLVSRRLRPRAINSIGDVLWVRLLTWEDCCLDQRRLTSVAPQEVVVFLIGYTQSDKCPKRLRVGRRVGVSSRPAHPSVPISDVSRLLPSQCLLSSPLLECGSSTANMMCGPNLLLSLPRLQPLIPTIASGVATGCSHVGIVPGDAAGRRVFSGISRFIIIGSQEPPKSLHSLTRTEFNFSTLRATCRGLKYIGVNHSRERDVESSTLQINHEEDWAVIPCCVCVQQRRVVNCCKSFTCFDWLNHFLTPGNCLHTNHVGAVPMLRILNDSVKYEDAFSSREQQPMGTDKLMSAFPCAWSVVYLTQACFSVLRQGASSVRLASVGSTCSAASEPLNMYSVYPPLQRVSRLRVWWEDCSKFSIPLCTSCSHSRNCRELSIALDQLPGEGVQQLRGIIYRRILIVDFCTSASWERAFTSSVLGVTLPRPTATTFQHFSVDGTRFPVALRNPAVMGATLTEVFKGVAQRSTTVPPTLHCSCVRARVCVCANTARYSGSYCLSQRSTTVPPTLHCSCVRVCVCVCEHGTVLGVVLSQPTINHCTSNTSLLVRARVCVCVCEHGTVLGVVLSQPTINHCTSNTSLLVRARVCVCEHGTVLGVVLSQPTINHCTSNTSLLVRARVCVCVRTRHGTRGRTVSANDQPLYLQHFIARACACVCVCANTARYSGSYCLSQRSTTVPPTLHCSCVRVCVCVCVCANTARYSGSYCLSQRSTTVPPTLLVRVNVSETVRQNGSCKMMNVVSFSVTCCSSSYRKAARIDEHSTARAGTGLIACGTGWAFIRPRGVQRMPNLNHRVPGGVVVRVLSSLGAPGSIPDGKWESCWMACFLGDIPFPPPLLSGAAPHSPRFTLISSRPQSSSLVSRVGLRVCQPTVLNASIVSSMALNLHEAGASIRATITCATSASSLLRATCANDTWGMLLHVMETHRLNYDCACESKGGGVMTADCSWRLLVACNTADIYRVRGQAKKYKLPSWNGPRTSLPSPHLETRPVNKHAAGRNCGKETCLRRVWAASQQVALVDYVGPLSETAVLTLLLCWVDLNTSPSAVVILGLAPDIL